MKISIAGTGKIAEEVMRMLHEEFPGEIEVTGIFAREHSVEHAIDLCQAYAPTGFVYTDYARMLDEAEADFVYIANANHVHHEYAMQAMQAGKNVIVEKPIAVNRVQTEELIDTALQRCVFCLPAYSLLYMPMLRKLQEFVPKIGKVRMIHCNYAQRSSRYDRYLNGEITPVFDPAMAGGTLADLKSATVYLRDPADAEVVRTILKKNLAFGLPLVIVRAPVCRPAWLVEMECFAVNAKGNSAFPGFF